MVVHHTKNKIFFDNLQVEYKYRSILQLNKLKINLCPITYN